jgi:predicted GIY-YIG superfamily endonuclease
MQLNKMKRKFPKAKEGFVYALLDEHGRVKIGVTTNHRRRLNGVRTAAGVDIVRAYVSEPLLEYLTVEQKVFAILKDKRGVGEWFDVGFYEARALIISIIDEVSK